MRVPGTTSIIFLLTAAHGENLLPASCAKLDGWTIIENGGVGWGETSDGDGDWAMTSFEWCTRNQTVNLLDAGYSADYLDNGPSLNVQATVRGFGDDSSAVDFYYLRVALWGSDRDTPLDTWTEGGGAASDDLGAVYLPHGYEKVFAHTFRFYGSGLRFITWEDGGKDPILGAGRYGAQMGSCAVEFAAPTATPTTAPAATNEEDDEENGGDDVGYTDAAKGSSNGFTLSLAEMLVLVGACCCLIGWCSSAMSFAFAKHLDRERLRRNEVFVDLMALSPGAQASTSGATATARESSPGPEHQVVRVVEMQAATSIQKPR